MAEPAPRRRERIAVDLDELGITLDGDGRADLVLEEIDEALRPRAHERTVPTTGTVVAPRSDPATWDAGTGLRIRRVDGAGQPLAAARRYADGQSTWLLRDGGERAHWLLFDRPAGSERDLVVLARNLDATIVQRSDHGVVRVVGTFGVARWERYSWHREPPVGDLLARIGAVDGAAAEALLTFAVHDLGAAGIGALLIHRGDGGPGPTVEERLAPPPALHIGDPAHLAPLRHALAQTDGAAVFDPGGTLRRLGVRLVPSRAAEASVDPLGGTRHTSGRRYSFDDPGALVIAVSEDGPVSVLRAGEILATTGPVG